MMDFPVGNIVIWHYSYLHRRQEQCKNINGTITQEEMILVPCPDHLGHSKKAK